MRTIALLVSVFALTVVSSACTTETAAPVANNKPKKGKTSHPGTDDQAGEHGTSAPADDPNGTADDPAAGDAIGTETWDTGKTLSANGTISAGATVTITPGATVNVGAGVAITVKGTLKIAAGATHAKMTGASWQGIIIAEGGKLDADGLDITGAKAGIWTQPGNLASTYKNGVLSAGSPFKMEAGSTLTVDHSKVTATDSSSSIAGTFVANYMDYDKGTDSGLILNDAAGTMTINNSTLHGGGSGDYVIANAGKKVTVTHSSIAGSHCAFHFQGTATVPGTESFLIDGVDVHDDGVGGMLYSSGAGPNEVKNTNFAGMKEYDISFGSDNKTKNGPIKFTNTFATVTKETNITVTDDPGGPLDPGVYGPLKE